MKENNRICWWRELARNSFNWSIFKSNFFEKVKSVEFSLSHKVPLSVITLSANRLEILYLVFPTTLMCARISFLDSRTMDPTTNGLTTGACLWSYHDRRHLIMCILMSTFMRRDNVDYVITNRHRQKDHLLHFEFISLKCHFTIRILIECQLMRSSEPKNYENLCDTRLIITEADTGGHASDLA